MSPEYKVEIVVPYRYVVDAADVGDAEKKAWQMFEDDLDDYGHPAVIESIDEIKEQSKAESGQTVGRNDLNEVENLIGTARDIHELPLTAMLYRLTAEGRMPKVVVQVDDETGQVEAARLWVAGVEYFFHHTTDSEGKPVEVIRHQGQTPEGHKVSAYELPFDGWGMGLGTREEEAI